MTTATFALVVVALVALSLALVVRALHLQVRRLSTEVGELRETLDVRVHAAQRAEQSFGDPFEQSGLERESEPEVEVAVITALSADAAADPVPEPSAGRVVSVTLAGPLMKAVAFSSGVRRALDDEHRMRVAYLYRKELKRQRKMRRRAAAARARHPEGRLS